MFWESAKLILDFLAPRQCAGCKKEKEALCYPCTQKSFKLGASCIFCNQRNGTGSICQTCKKIYNPSFEKSLWAGEYKNALKNAIWELKYKKRKELAKPLGELIFKKFSEFYPKFKKEDFLIIPIPMHQKKQYERKYNQAELLAKEFGKLSHIPLLVSSLLKVKETKTQVETKTKEERIKNLDGTFSFHDPSQAWVNRAIILIDDVATTGATFLHASRAIQKETTPPFEDEVKIICIAVAHGYG